MIIIGKAKCSRCITLKKQFPNFKYIEIPDKAETPEMREIKKRVGKLQFKMYPIIVDDSISQILGGN